MMENNEEWAQLQSAVGSPLPAPRPDEGRGEWSASGADCHNIVSAPLSPVRPSLVTAYGKRDPMLRRWQVSRLALQQHPDLTAVTGESDSG